MQSILNKEDFRHDVTMVRVTLELLYYHLHSHYNNAVELRSYKLARNATR